MRHSIAISALQTLFDSRWVDLNPETERAVHGRGERLCTTHSAQSASHQQPAFERAAEMTCAGSGEGLKSALDDSLAGNVNPRPGGHLAIHRQTKFFETIELRII